MKPIDVAQQYLAAVYRGDLASAAARLSPEIELVMNGCGELAGSYRGLERFFAAFAHMQDITAGTYRLAQQRAWLGNDQHAVLIAQEEAMRSEQLLQFERVIVYTVALDQITKVQVFEGDPNVSNHAFTG